ARWCCARLYLSRSFLPTFAFCPWRTQLARHRTEAMPTAIPLRGRMPFSISPAALLTTPPLAIIAFILIQPATATPQLAHLRLFTTQPAPPTPQLVLAHSPPTQPAFSTQPSAMQRLAATQPAPGIRPA